MKNWIKRVASGLGLVEVPWWDRDWEEEEAVEAQEKVPMVSGEPLRVALAARAARMGGEVA